MRELGPIPLFLALYISLPVRPGGGDFRCLKEETEKQNISQTCDCGTFSSEKLSSTFDIRNGQRKSAWVKGMSSSLHMNAYFNLGM